MSQGRASTPTSEASCSLAALASSAEFVHALQRDVHILLDAFALTWLWLEQPTDAPTSLRWAYGPMTVLQRVWVRNQWPNVSAVISTDPYTRRAFTQAVADAFLDRLAIATSHTPVEPPTLLHAVGALLGLYTWWKAQPKGSWPAIRVDPAAYAAMTALPELAQPVLDEGASASSSALPPSADVWYVVQQMLGTPSSPGCVHLYMAPRHSPRLRATTALMTRKQREACVRLTAPIGTSDAPQPVPSRRAPRGLPDDVWQDLGVPGPERSTEPRITAHTAQSLDTLVHAQQAYARAQKAAEESVAWDASSWDEGRSLSLPTILAYLERTSAASTS